MQGQGYYGDVLPQGAVPMIDPSNPNPLGIVSGDTPKLSRKKIKWEIKKLKKKEKKRQLVADQGDEVNRKSDDPGTVSGGSGQGANTRLSKGNQTTSNSLLATSSSSNTMESLSAKLSAVSIGYQTKTATTVSK